MSRQFDTAGGTDFITFSVGSAPPDQGPITVAVLAKSASVAGFTMWMARGLKSGTPVWGFLTSNNAGPKLFAENDFGNGVSGLSTSWRWYVMTKAAGSAIPRFHVWDLSGAWSHTDNSANVGDGTGPIDTLYIGAGSGSTNWRGSIAVVATWASALSDGAIESACTLAASATFSASPGWMVRLNQASTATSITDDTGNGGNQSAISGTSVDADDPPGFNYALTNNVDGTVAQTVTATGAVTAAADRSSTAPQTVTATAAAVADVQLGQTVAQTVTAAGTVAGQVIHNATVAQTITVTGTVTPEPAPAAARQDHWMSLMSVLSDNQAQADWWLNQRVVTTCPIHEYRLDPGPTPGTLHCGFGGELYDLHGKPALI